MTPESQAACVCIHTLVQSHVRTHRVDGTYSGPKVGPSQRYSECRQSGRVVVVVADVDGAAATTALLKIFNSVRTFPTPSSMFGKHAHTRTYVEHTHDKCTECMCVGDARESHAMGYLDNLDHDEQHSA